jgi:hypothetical protein
MKNRYNMEMPLLVFKFYTSARPGITPTTQIERPKTVTTWEMPLLVFKFYTSARPGITPTTQIETQTRYNMGDAVVGVQILHDLQDQDHTTTQIERPKTVTTREMPLLVFKFYMICKTRDHNNTGRKTQNRYSMGDAVVGVKILQDMQNQVSQQHR